MDPSELEIYSDFGTLNQWQKIYCVSVTLSLIFLFLFLVWTGYFSLNDLIFNDPTSKNAVSDLRGLVGSVVLAFMAFRFWKRRVLELFIRTKILTYSQEGLTYFYDIDYTIDTLIPFDQIAHVTRVSKNDIEIKFNGVVHTYKPTLSDSSKVVPVSRFEVLGNADQIDRFLDVLAKKKISIESYPLGDGFDRMKETAHLILGLAVIFGGLFAVMYFALRK